MNLPYECENLLKLKQMWDYNFFPIHVSGNVISEFTNKENKTESYDLPKLILYVVLGSWWIHLSEPWTWFFQIWQVPIMTSANRSFRRVAHCRMFKVLCLFGAFGVMLAGISVLVCCISSHLFSFFFFFLITKWFRSLHSVFLLVTCIFGWMLMNGNQPVCLEGCCSLLLDLELKHIHGLPGN